MRVDRAAVGDVACASLSAAQETHVAHGVACVRRVCSSAGLAPCELRSSLNRMVGARSSGFVCWRTLTLVAIACMLCADLNRRLENCVRALSFTFDGDTGRRPRCAYPHAWCARGEGELLRFRYSHPFSDESFAAATVDFCEHTTLLDHGIFLARLCARMQVRTRDLHAPA